MAFLKEKAGGTKWKTHEKEFQWSERILGEFY